MNIPNMPPFSPAVDENGYRTPVEQIFMQQLITQLQQGAGNEGLVAPTLTNVAPDFQITTIENNTDVQGFYTLLPGTIIYNATQAAINPLTSIMIAVPSGGTPPVQFKTVTLT